ncbi:MAG: efflux RND transporter periplasmic adaptor subunit [Flavobacteriales bacterium]
MKRIVSILLVSTLVWSCGNETKTSATFDPNTTDVKALRAQKTNLAHQVVELNKQIEQLEVKLSSLDNTKKLDLVTVETLKTTNLKHYLEIQGSVQTKQNILIYPELAGQLNRVLVKEGQRVAKGQVLATIDDGGMAQQKAQMVIQRDLAKTTFERQAKLWEKSIGSEIQFLQAKANYEAQDKAIAQLEKSLAKTKITAPFSGVIDVVFKEQGNVVSPGPGAEIFRIVNLNNMYIEANIPESYLTKIRKGSEVKVIFPVLNKTISSSVRQVGNFINPNNRTFSLEVAVPNRSGDIKPNLTSRLKINDYTNPEAILVPQHVISEDANGNQFVFVAEQKGAQTISKKQIVETGVHQEGNVEILKGLKTGDRVIVDGARTVKNEQEIQVKTKKA